MKKTDVLEKIGREKLIPVIRTPDISEARQAVNIIGSGGINIFEITLTIPGATDLIGELSTTDYLIGAGTVLTLKQAEACVSAGAKFIVSPILDKEIVKFCNEKEVAVMPAGLTPTEIYRAHQSGADCVKIFPCDAVGGAKYLKAMRSVFPEIKMMPTGGVTLETIGGFLEAGAFAVGVGSDMVDLSAIRAGDADTIAAKAARFIEIVKNA